MGKLIILIHPAVDIKKAKLLKNLTANPNLPLQMLILVLIDWVQRLELTVSGLESIIYVASGDSSNGLVALSA